MRHLGTIFAVLTLVVSDLALPGEKAADKPAAKPSAKPAPAPAPAKVAEAAKTDKQIYAATDTVKVTPLVAPEGGRLLWVDGYHRVLREFPCAGAARPVAEQNGAKKEEGKKDPVQETAVAVGREFSFTLDAPTSRFNFLMAVDAAGGLVAKTEFVVTPDIPRWDDFELFMYGGGYDARNPKSEAFKDYYRHLRSVNINGGMSYENGVPAHEAIARNDFRYYCEYCVGKGLFHLRAFTQNYWPAFMGAHRAGNFDPEKKYFFRKPCLDDPEVQAEGLKNMERVVLEHRAFRPGAYSIADEPSATGFCNAFDYCFCPHSLKAFRIWLKERYKTLEALNAQWETAFKDWGEVRPDDSNEAKARNNPQYAKVLNTKVGGVQLAERNLFPEELTEPGRENFSSWADHRSFTDQSFVDLLGKLVKRTRELDPYDPAGILGTQMPSAFGGWDFWKLLQNIDWFEAYDMGNSVEIIRSWRGPNTVMAQTLFGNGSSRRYQTWYYFLHGGQGRVLYESAHYFTGKGTTSAGAGMRTTWTELRGGLAKLTHRLTPIDQPIGIYINHPSRQVSWIYDSEFDGTTWPRRFSSWDSARCSMLQAATGIIRAIEDAGCQYKYIAAEQAVAGELSKYRIVFMPKIVSLSQAEAEALRKFVEEGGMLVCDEAPGTFDEHCRRRKAGLLDEVFGVSRVNFLFCERDGGYLRLNKNVLLPTAQAAAEPLAKDVNTKRLYPVTPGLRAAKATALAAAGETPALLVNRFGKGTAVCTNLYWADYGKLRRYAELSAPFLKLVENLLQAAGQKPYFEIYERQAGAPAAAEGKRPERMERFWFGSGDARYAAFLVNGQVTQTELGDISVEGVEFGKMLPLSVKLPEKRHVYNPRTNEYLGETDLAAVELDPFGAVVLSLLPYQVEKIEVSREQPKENEGEDPLLVRYAAAVKASGGKAGLHVLHLDVLDPDGILTDFDAKNLVGENGTVAGSLRLAANGKAGQWTLRFRDAASGVTGTLEVEKKAPPLLAEAFRIDFPLQDGALYGEVEKPLKVLERDGQVRATVPVKAWSDGLRQPQGKIKLSANAPWKLDTEELDLAPLTFRSQGETVVEAVAPKDADWKKAGLQVTAKLSCADGRTLDFGMGKPVPGELLAKMLEGVPPVRLVFENYYEDILRISVKPGQVEHQLPCTLQLTGGTVPPGKVLFSVTEGWKIEPAEVDLQECLLTARGEVDLKVSGPLPFKEEPLVTAKIVSEGRERAFARRLRIAMARSVAKPPALDGKMDDECWKDAQVLAPFLSDGSANVFPMPTQMRVCWDAENLYVAVEAGGRDPEKLKLTPPLDPKSANEEAQKVLEAAQEKVAALQKTAEEEAQKLAAEAKDRSAATVKSVEEELQKAAAAIKDAADKKDADPKAAAEAKEAEKRAQKALAEAKKKADADQADAGKKAQKILADAKNKAAAELKGAEQKAAKIRESVAERGLWGDDHVEVTLDPTQKVGKAPYQLAANILGRRYDAVSEELAWNGQWRSGGAKTADGYVMEFAIPFKTLATETPKPLGVWAFNAYRNDFEPKDAFATWSQLGDSRASQAFGRLIFLEAGR